MKSTELQGEGAPPDEDAQEGAVVKFYPKEPIGSRKNLQDLLNQQMGALRQILPKHVTPERLVKTLLVTVNRTPDLMLCTQESVLESIFRAAELGLDVSGTLGEAYLVPFNNRVKAADGTEAWQKQATFIPGYRGLAKLARQSGEVANIEANVVYTEDLFDFEQGTNFHLTYKRSLADTRGKVLGAYALVTFKDGTHHADFMTEADVEKVRQRAMSKNSPAWKQHWDEMARKTVFRRLAKWLPLSGEKYQKAVEIDNEDFDFDLTTGPDVEQLTAGAELDAAMKVEEGTGAPEDATEPSDGAGATDTPPETDTAPEDAPEAQEEPNKPPRRTRKKTVKPEPPVENPTPAAASSPEQTPPHTADAMVQETGPSSDPTPTSPDSTEPLPASPTSTDTDSTTSTKNSPGTPPSSSETADESSDAPPDQDALLDEIEAMEEKVFPGPTENTRNRRRSRFTDTMKETPLEEASTEGLIAYRDHLAGVLK